MTHAQKWSQSCNVGSVFVIFLVSVMIQTAIQAQWICKNQLVHYIYTVVFIIGILFSLQFEVRSPQGHDSTDSSDTYTSWMSKMARTVTFDPISTSGGITIKFNID